jgi:hypothetical protein
MSATYDPTPRGKPILCLDFDGCIHSYKSGWKGAAIILDPPVPGVFEWVREALQYFDVHIYSSRSQEHEGRAAMKRYIDGYAPDISQVLVYSHTKPRAFLTIDDRCVSFGGDWGDPLIEPRRLLAFRPWYKDQK